MFSNFPDEVDSRAICRCVFAIILLCFCIQSHAQFDITLELDTANVVDPFGALEAFGTLTNEPSSLATLALDELDLLVTFAFSGTTTELPYDVSILESSSLPFFSSVLRNHDLSPGDSIEFYLFTLTPLSPPVATGDYDIATEICISRQLSLPQFTGLCPLQSEATFAVVPEPRISILWYLGLGIVGLASCLRPKFKGTRSTRLTKSYANLRRITKR